VIICEIVVHLLVRVQNNKRCTVHGINNKVDTYIHMWTVWTSVTLGSPNQRSQARIKMKQVYPQCFQM